MAQIEPTIYRPDLAVPPGETVAELLRDHEMSIIELAVRTGLSEDDTFSMLRGEIEITTDLANSLAETFDLPVHFWMNLEKTYREVLDRIEQEEENLENIKFSKHFPIHELVHLGWFDRGRNALETARNLLDFLAIESWKDFTATKVYKAAFRKSTVKVACDYALAAWLKKGEIEAEEIDTAPFNHAGIGPVISNLRKLTRLAPDEFARTIVSLCKPHGVAVVFVPHIKKCHANGAAFRVGPKMVVQLSLRFKTNDHFWFSFFHELGHVILHGDVHSFVDDFVSRGDSLEGEANEFAATTLIPKTEYSSFLAGRSLSRNAIVEFSDRIGLAPGIVVGRLQHDRIIPPDRFNELKQRLEWAK